MTNVRVRNQVGLNAENTKPARLPAIPPATDEFQRAVKEHLELRQGSRGNPFERGLTARDLVDLGLTRGDGLAQPSDAPGVMIRLPNGQYAAYAVDAFGDLIRNSALFKTLTQRLDDVERFADLPEEVQKVLLNSIAEEAARRGADIQRLEYKQQTDAESLAYRVEEVTAAVSGASAGVRQLTFAQSDVNRAVAGVITQVQSRLNNFSDGLPGVATIEQVFKTVADRTKGLEATATIKTEVTAGGVRAAAGIGISASIDPSGAADSAIYFLARRFAFILDNDVIPDPKNPPLNRIPFGIDERGMYINSTVYIKTPGGGVSVADVAINGSVPAINFVGSFASAPNPASFGFKKNSVYRNTTDNNSYILTADWDKGGVWTLYLTSGTRGSRTIYITRSSWSDGAADDAVTLTTGSPTKVIGDTVTQSSSNFAETRYWSGFGWVLAGVVIDGNLLVNGTISGQKIAAQTIQADNINSLAIRANHLAAGSVTAQNGAIADLAVGTLKIGDNAVTVPAFGSSGFGAFPFCGLFMDVPGSVYVTTTVWLQGGSPSGGNLTTDVSLQLNCSSGESKAYTVIGAAPGFATSITTASLFTLPPGYWLFSSSSQSAAAGGAHQPIAGSIMAMGAKK